MKVKDYVKKNLKNAQFKDKVIKAVKEVLSYTPYNQKKEQPNEVVKPGQPKQKQVQQQGKPQVPQQGKPNLVQPQKTQTPKQVPNQQEPVTQKSNPKQVAPNSQPTKTQPALTQKQKMEQKKQEQDALKNKPGI